MYERLQKPLNARKGVQAFNYHSVMHLLSYKQHNSYMLGGANITRCVKKKRRYVVGGENDGILEWRVLTVQG